MAALSLRLSDELDSRLDTEARLTGLVRSDVAREAIEQYLARRERERLIAGFVAETRMLYGDPELRAEGLALAEEAVETSNEALDIAEHGRSPRGQRKHGAGRR